MFLLILLKNVAKIILHLLFDWTRSPLHNWFILNHNLRDWSTLNFGIIILRAHFGNFPDVKEISIPLKWQLWLILGKIRTKFELSLRWLFRQGFLLLLFIEDFIIELDLILEVFLWAVQISQPFFFILVNRNFWSVRLEIRCLVQSQNLLLPRRQLTNVVAALAYSVHHQLGVRSCLMSNIVHSGPRLKVSSVVGLKPLVARAKGNLAQVPRDLFFRRLLVVLIVGARTHWAAMSSVSNLRFMVSNKPLASCSVFAIHL